MDKAIIERGKANTSLILDVKGNQYKIPLTEDRPNDVKEVFNRLLVELKKGQINFELDDKKEDLYHHLCKEYLRQLNAELRSIYGELKDYGLLAKK